MVTPRLPHSTHPVHAVDPLAGLSPDVPLLLLPVRVETAWIPVEGTTNIELLIRVFPDEIHVAASADSDEQPVVSALPQRWLAIAKAPGLRIMVTGEPIASSLPAAPHHTDDGSDPSAFLGKTLAWMTDFTTAVSLGMAMRVTMARADAERLEELIVIGVGTGDPDAQGAAFGDLIARHATGDGAALLPPGTPTNVTGRAADPVLAPIGTAPAGDPARVIAALGIADAAAASVTADATDRGAIARAMHVALWPATWGYYLAELAGRTPAEVAAARALFVERVRPAGEFPALRVRSQPYGVLPATSLARWPAAAEHGALAAFLVRLAATWQPAVAAIPRLVDSLDLDRDLVALLRRLPASIGAWVRECWDADTAAIKIGNFAKVRTILAAIHAQQAAALGLAGQMPIFDRVFADDVKRLGIPYVAPAAANRSLPLAHNYLSAIATASPSQLAAHEVDGATPRTLLYLLARHSSTRLRSAVRPPNAVGHQPVLAHAVPTSVWTRIADLGDLVFADPAVLELHAALRMLGVQAVGELEIAFAGALDAASYRLDAWETALASERLATLRVARPRASYVGGWAWLERPRPSSRPAGRGYLHAPSMAQARTAAVLRAGYEAHRADGPGTSLAIDLSSERVRDARWLLAGMREGRPLSRLLGDHIERFLLRKDPTFDLLDLRRASAPGVSPVLDLADGWALFHRWTAHEPSGVVLDAFRDVRELLDGVSDLLLADSVHNAVAGSTARAAAALDALQRGEVATPDPRVDRTGTQVAGTQHRVVLMLDDAPGWPGGPRPRAVASPRLEGLAARVLGPPAAVGITITDTTDTTETTTTRTVADLDLCALDVVVLAATGTERQLLDVAAASLPQQPGAVRSTAGGPALDELVLRAAALARLFRGAATPRPGDLGGTVVSPPADRSADVAGAIAAHAGVLADAIAAAGGAGERAIAGIVGGGFAVPAPVGGFVDADVVPSAPGDLLAWLSDHGRVRAQLEPLDLLALLAPELVAGERRRTSAGVELTVFGSPTASEALIVDAWSEAALAESVTTGVAFPFEAPRAQPPQVILIAVPPPSTPWSLKLAESIIDETVAAAKLRMAAPEDVHDQLVPTVLVADDPDDLEPSFDLQVVSAAVHLEALP